MKIFYRWDVCLHVGPLSGCQLFRSDYKLSRAIVFCIGGNLVDLIPWPPCRNTRDQAFSWKKFSSADLASPSKCQQDMCIPSIVFITLQLPNMFYPSRISDSEKKSLLRASPSSLMPMLCLHLKHSSSLHNHGGVKRFLSAHHQKASI